MMSGHTFTSPSKQGFMMLVKRDWRTTYITGCTRSTLWSGCAGVFHRLEANAGLGDWIAIATFSQVSRNEWYEKFLLDVYLVLQRSTVQRGQADVRGMTSNPHFMRNRIFAWQIPQRRIASQILILGSVHDSRKPLRNTASTRTFQVQAFKLTANPWTNRATAGKGLPVSLPRSLPAFYKNKTKTKRKQKKGDTYAYPELINAGECTAPRRWRDAAEKVTSTCS